MALNDHQKRSIYVRLSLAIICIIILLALGLTNHVKGATFTVANRCEPTKDGASFGYSCPAAFPESFTLAGTAIDARYHINWSLSCDGKTVAGAQEDGGLVVHVYAGRFSKKGSQAYKAFSLMESASGSCTISVAGQRISGHGRFKGELTINVNHPAPIL